MLTITETDARWLAAAGIDQAPTRAAVVLAAARHWLAMLAWLAILLGVVAVFWIGAATVLAPVLAAVAGWLSTAVHGLIVAVEGVTAR